MTDPIRWGILGASAFARADMAPAIHAARGHVLTALATRSPDKAVPFRALVPSLRVMDDYGALLADPDIDAVYVPLPNAMHVDWGLRALEAGKHVLIEKPLALEATSITPLIEARDRTGLVAAEAYMIVHHPQWRHVRDLIANGAIGPVRHVDATFTFDNRDDPSNFRNAAEMGGGALPDIGVYAIGATRLALGTEPDDIPLADLEWQDGVDVLARVAARFPGVTANWLVSMRMDRHQSLTILGEGGWIKMAAPFNPSRYAAARVDWRGTDGVTHSRDWHGIDQYVLQVEAFGAAIRGTAPFPWTLEDAAGTQRVIDTIYAVGGRP